MTGAIVPPAIPMPPRSASALAEAMTQTTNQSQVLRRWGLIAAIYTNGTVDIDLAGVIIPNIKHNAAYTPTIGERVLIDVVGTDMTVLGAAGVSPRKHNRPTGDIEPTIRKTPKPDTLLLNGQTVNRADYPRLFAWVQEQGLLTTAQAPNNLFGAGNGTTTFVLPDFRGRTVVGATDALPVGSKFGADNQTLTTAQMPAHKHSVAVADHPTHTHSFTTDAQGAHTHTLTVANGGGHFHSNNFNTSSAGNHGAHPPYQIPVQSGTGANDVWAGGGVNTGSHTHSVAGDTSTAAAHTHTATAANSTTHTHAGTTGATSGGTHTVTETTVGGTTPVDVRQPSFAVNWLIWV